VNALLCEKAEVEPARYREEFAASGTSEVTDTNPGGQSDHAAEHDNGVRNRQFDFAMKAPAEKHGTKGQ
jgi:hypothetical protein